jgi:hypothetical protein
MVESAKKIMGEGNIELDFSPNFNVKWLNNTSGESELRKG